MSPSYKNNCKCKIFIASISGEYAEGTSVTITADAAAEGKRFDSWTIEPADVNFTQGNTTSAAVTFTMPAKAVTATARYVDLASDTYAVNVLNDGHGIGSANVCVAAADNEITLIATPNSGYQFKEWQVINGSVTIADNKFIMPGENVTVKAVFEAIPATKISPTTAEFDKTEANQQDIEVSMTLNGNTLDAVKNGTAVLNAGDDYFVEGNIVTIKKEYLAAQEVGEVVLTFDFSDGADLTLRVEVTEIIDECFVATACFGSKYSPAVALLRQFRDQFLLTNKPGQTFVKFYYNNSPPIADFIRQSEGLKLLTRIALTPFIIFALACIYQIQTIIVLIGVIFIFLIHQLRKKQRFC